MGYEKQFMFDFKSDFKMQFPTSVVVMWIRLSTCS